MVLPADDSHFSAACHYFCFMMHLRMLFFKMVFIIIRKVRVHVTLGQFIITETYFAARFDFWTKKGGAAFVIVHTKLIVVAVAFSRLLLIIIRFKIHDEITIYIERWLFTCWHHGVVCALEFWQSHRPYRNFVVSELEWNSYGIMYRIFNDDNLLLFLFFF